MLRIVYIMIMISLNIRDVLSQSLPRVEYSTIRMLLISISQTAKCFVEYKQSISRDIDAAPALRTDKI